MGKIMECRGQCAVLKGRSMIAMMRKDSFDLTLLNPLERCTPLAVAAHSLYEKARPDQLPDPGGVLHLNTAKYELLADGRTTRCSGTRFVPTPVYQVKLEGVAKVGHRAIFIGGFRDPILIAGLDDLLDRVRSYTKAKKRVPSSTAPLSAIASVVRHKNSGPFELTFDVMFDDDAHFRRVRNADPLNNDVICRLYHIKPEDIVVSMYFEAALAWKCTIRRPWAQGSVGERDTLGTAQHAPLLGIVVPPLEE
ncbi:putative caib baif family enzyme protein [Phaeoacremonium minimum UCRPA7]|uniref:Putative caib baif family enzyme protein n=1 Tax=Phaeoacremonium minimum (strain UCR-PA7) TaxID=1286976 RepID=R8BMK8_PHAM7|nr:putative caib baif family enzyme protein [Phaeoacremonium minimum UCRPA7]EOO00589.1 putative caib baif family enzyme protein [Phaeoacremonium minimum UCRPA7]